MKLGDIGKHLRGPSDNLLMERFQNNFFFEKGLFWSHRVTCKCHAGPLSLTHSLPRFWPCVLIFEIRPDPWRIWSHGPLPQATSCYITFPNNA